MRVVIIVSIFLSSQFIFISCEKDNKSTYPKELNFSEVKTDLQLWVGGIEIENKDINPEDIFEDELFQWAEDLQEGLKSFTFKFKSENEVNVINNETSIESVCLNKNDSIFLLNSNDSYFIGTGNHNEISSYANCLLYGIHYNENTAKAFYTTSTEPTTVEQMLEEFNLSNLEEMNEKDTIAIMNYVIIYR